MHLFEEIRKRAEAVPPEELLSRMGYNTLKANQLSRLQEVMADPWLGLEASEYDFVHDSHGFLLALCEALGLEAASTRLRVDAIIAQLEAKAAVFRPWLRIESGGSDDAAKAGNWLSRGAATLGRKLPLDHEAHGQPLERIIEVARQAILTHQRDSGGLLPSGFRIDGYLLFHHAEQATLRMNTEGMVVGTGLTPRGPLV